MRRSLAATRLRWLVGPSVGLAVVLGLAPLAGADDEKCTIATQQSSPVQQACDKGGRKEAAKLMRSMVQKAKAKGVTMKCGVCHEDLDTYELKATAKDDYKKLLAAQ